MGLLPNQILGKAVKLIEWRSSSEDLHPL